jgi:hypothetical protein
MREGAALILGAFVNAYGIAKSLKEIGWTGPIVAHVDAESDPRLLATLGYVIIWRDTLQQPSDILRLALDRLPDSTVTVFTTDERYLPALAEADDPRLIAPVGSRKHLRAILDRFEFYEFLEEHRIGSFPTTIASDQDPEQAFGRHYLVRVRESWRGLQKLPRSKDVHSREQHDAFLAQLRRVGLEPHEWCYQELLSTSPEHNVSVCGWYGRGFKVVATTRKVVDWPKRVGNGTVVEILEPNAELERQAERLLAAMEYEGVFELEFVYDSVAREYKIIELNPRFWMQHRLLAKVSDNALVRAHAGEDFAEPDRSGWPGWRWLGTQNFIKALAGRDLRAVPYLVGEKTVREPDWSTLAKWLGSRRKA